MEEARHEERDRPQHVADEEDLMPPRPHPLQAPQHDHHERSSGSDPPDVVRLRECAAEVGKVVGRVDAVGAVDDDVHETEQERQPADPAVEPEQVLPRQEKVKACQLDEYERRYGV